jgi:hypothetical protein
MQIQGANQIQPGDCLQSEYPEKEQSRPFSLLREL